MEKIFVFQQENLTKIESVQKKLKFFATDKDIKNIEHYTLNMIQEFKINAIKKFLDKKEGFKSLKLLGLQIKNIDNGERTPIQLYEQETARHDDNYSRNIIENAYESEIEAFVSTIRDGKKPVYGYNDDVETLSWIDKIEEGME